MVFLRPKDVVLGGRRHLSIRRVSSHQSWGAPLRVGRTLFWGRPSFVWKNTAFSPPWKRGGFNPKPLLSTQHEGGPLGENREKRGQTGFARLTTLAEKGPPGGILGFALCPQFGPLSRVPSQQTLGIRGPSSEPDQIPTSLRIHFETAVIKVWLRNGWTFEGCYSVRD